MVTFVSFISKDNIENTGWNKNSFNKLHNIVDKTNNRFIEYKNKKKNKVANKMSIILDEYYNVNKTPSLGFLDMNFLCLKEFESLFSVKIYMFWADSMTISKPLNLISQDQKIWKPHYS